MESSTPPIPSRSVAGGFAPSPDEVTDRPDVPEKDEDDAAAHHTPDTEEVIDEDAPADLLSTIREARKEAQPFGKTKVLEVPGYKGLLAIEYQYIGAEVTENIARRVQRETRNQNGQGVALLSSIDTLRAACKRVLIRRKVGDPWMSIGGQSQSHVRLDVKLSALLNYTAENGREVVLGLFGSEHKITQQNLVLSRWLADQTRESDEDFL